MEGCACNTCQQTQRYVRSAFHSLPNDANSMIWQPRRDANNTLTFEVTGDSLCVTSSQFQLRYSSMLFQNYPSVSSNMFWAGVGLAIFVCLIPLLLCGQLIHGCVSSNTGTITVLTETAPLLNEANAFSKYKGGKQNQEIDLLLGSRDKHQIL